jgi:soluble lytic murein transglycosylase-like protein
MVRLFVFVACCVTVMTSAIAVARADDSVSLYHRGVAAGTSSSSKINSKVTSVEAMRAYVAAIRYFNPGIDEPEAQHIVYAILKEAFAQGVEPRLVVSIVAVESAFDRTARSSAGAEGLGQLMPGTAAADNVWDTGDIDQNIRGTVLTLKGDLAHYAGYKPQRQFELAIAAYNAGTGAVDKYGDVPPYDETINYVTKVITLWRRFYGLSPG